MNLTAENELFGWMLLQPFRCQLCLPSRHMLYLVFFHNLRAPCQTKKGIFLSHIYVQSKSQTLLFWLMFQAALCQDPVVVDILFFKTCKQVQ